MNKIKEGVRLYGIKPEMIVGKQVVDSVFASYGYDSVVTSALDGEHGEGSYHPLGYALDFRTKHVKGGYSVIVAITSDVKDALGDEFDVVLESTHLHVEYDLNKVRIGNG